MVRIVCVPYGGGGLGHGDGSRDGPQAILEAAQELYADEYGNPVVLDVDDSAVSQSHETIERAARDSSEPTIFLGGDHSITTPLVRGCSAKALLVFDAHPDVMDDFSPPTQEDYLRVLIEEGSLDPQNIVVVGVRNWDVQEREYLDQKGVGYVLMKDVFSQGIQATMDDVLARLPDELYVSVDIDAVDPVEAIGTGYTEHGGMSSRELLYALHRVLDEKTVKYADIVEVNPEKDVNNLTASLGAKLLVELSRLSQ